MIVIVKHVSSNAFIDTWQIWRCQKDNGKLYIEGRNWISNVIWRLVRKNMTCLCMLYVQWVVCMMPPVLFTLFVFVWRIVVFNTCYVMLCCAFVLFLVVLCTLYFHFFLDYPFLIASSVFTNVCDCWLCYIGETVDHFEYNSLYILLRWSFLAHCYADLSDLFQSSPISRFYIL